MGTTTVYLVSPSNGTNLASGGYWTCPSGVTSVTVSCWGGGGGGFTNGAGGGAGAFASNTISVTAGTTYTVQIGSGGTAGSAGTATWFISSATLNANGGAAGTSTTGGAGGAAGTTGTTHVAGGAGASKSGGGGGGGAGGPDGAGNTATTSTGGSADAGSGGAGGTSGNAGTEDDDHGGGGGGGKASASPGAGGFPGGGGGGGTATGITGGAGADGLIKITYSGTTQTVYVIQNSNNGGNLTGTWKCPSNVTSVTAQCWGAGGGGSATSGQGGGGGGAYASGTVSVTAGNSYNWQTGTGGGASTTPGGTTWFSSSTTVSAVGGGSTNSASAGSGGAAASCFGTTKNSGGNGSTSGGGGGAAGPDGAGGAASGTTGGTGDNGLGGAGGTAGNQGGHDQLRGGGGSGNGTTHGGGYFGGGGAAGGGGGASGQIILTYAPVTTQALTATCLSVSTILPKPIFPHVGGTLAGTGFSRSSASIFSNKVSLSGRITSNNIVYPDLGISDAVINVAANVGNIDFAVDSAEHAYSITFPENTTNHVRFELHLGDTWSGDVGQPKERTELDGYPTAWANGTYINVTYEFYVEPGPATNASYTIVGQCHQTGGTAGFSPIFEIDLNGDKMQVFVNNASNTDPMVYGDSNAITRAHWYKMEIYFKLDTTSSGFLTIYRDNALMMNYSGAVGWSGMGNGYWKYGIYRRNDDTNPLTVHYRNMKISTGQAQRLTGGLNAAKSSGKASATVVSTIVAIASAAMSKANSFGSIFAKAGLTSKVLTKASASDTVTGKAALSGKALTVSSEKTNASSFAMILTGAAARTMASIAPNLAPRALISGKTSGNAATKGSLGAKATLAGSAFSSAKTVAGNFIPSVFLKSLSSFVSFQRVSVSAATGLNAKAATKASGNSSPTGKTPLSALVSSVARSTAPLLSKGFMRGLSLFTAQNRVSTYTGLAALFGKSQSVTDGNATRTGTTGLNAKSFSSTSGKNTVAGRTALAATASAVSYTISATIHGATQLVAASKSITSLATTIAATAFVSASGKMSGWANLGVNATRALMGQVLALMGAQGSPTGRAGLSGTASATSQASNQNMGIVLQISGALASCVSSAASQIVNIIPLLSLLRSASSGSSLPPTGKTTLSGQVTSKTSGNWNSYISFLIASSVGSFKSSSRLGLAFVRWVIASSQARSNLTGKFSPPTGVTSLRGQTFTSSFAQANPLIRMPVAAALHAASAARSMLSATWLGSLFGKSQGQSRGSTSYTAFMGANTLTLTKSSASSKATANMTSKSVFKMASSGKAVFPWFGSAVSKFVSQASSTVGGKAVLSGKSLSSSSLRNITDHVTYLSAKAYSVSRIVSRATFLWLGTGTASALSFISSDVFGRAAHLKAKGQSKSLGAALPEGSTKLSGKSVFIAKSKNRPSSLRFFTASGYFQSSGRVPQWVNYTFARLSATARFSSSSLSSFFMLAVDPEYIQLAATWDEPRNFVVTEQNRNYTSSDTGGLTRSQMTLSSKDPAEKVTVTFDFTPVLAVGETISSVSSVVCTAWIGVDGAASSMLIGSPAIQGLMVLQLVQGGLTGNYYKIKATINTSLGQIIACTATLPVVSQ